MTRAVGAAAAVLIVSWVAALHATTRAAQPEPCAPARLSDTGLFAANGSVAPGVRPYSPQYPLWTDGAKKARWIYLPPGTAIDTAGAADWAFPVGTRFWKEFSFNGRKVETRFLWRASPDRWIFASYAWNAEGTDAVLAPDDGLAGVADLGAGKHHDIPGVSECQACHGTTRPGPLGFNPLQLSTERDPNAIHGEPLAP